jgi:hypothetical protein
METNMKENGISVISTEKEQIISLTVIFIEENIKEESQMVMESIHGLMGALMKDILKMV